MQTARMVGVQMGEDDGPHILGTDADLEQLRPDLLFRCNVEMDCQPEVWVSTGEVARFSGPGGLPRVHHDHTINRLDRPGVDWERFGPGTIEQDVQLPDGASSTPDTLTGFYSHGPGL